MLIALPLLRSGSRLVLAIQAAILLSLFSPAQAAAQRSPEPRTPGVEPKSPTASLAADVIDPPLRAALTAPGAGPTQFVVEFAGPAGLQTSPAAAATDADWGERGAQVVAALQQNAAQAQATARALLIQRGIPYRDLWIFNALAVAGTWSDAQSLAAQPNVTRVRLPRRYPLHMPVVVQPAGWPAQEDKPPFDASASPLFASLGAIDTHGGPALPWGLTKIRADRVWDELGARGEGIVIGSIDTGARVTHGALANQYRGNLGNGRFIHHYNWFDPEGDPAPFDNVGHGTHTLGTILGDDGGEYRIGVAPGATWIAAKGCASNWCTDVDLALAGQWMLAPTRLDGSQPDPSRRPHIVNNSWGADAWDPFYQAVVSAWRAAGIYPVFSIGNAGPSCDSAGSPGTYNTALGVGATTSSDQIAAFSSRGPSRDPATPGAIKPDLSAPGESVLSALAERDDEYGYLSGTSMAAPHVVGAIALMWSASPSLIGQLVLTTQILTSTARAIPNSFNCGEGVGKAPNNTYGWGRLDAYSATLRAITSTPPTGALAVRAIVSGTGAPAQAVTMRLDVSPAQSLQGLSDANGAIRMRAPAGSYTLTARHPQFRPVQRPVVVSAGVTASIVITLSPRARWTISGTVRDAQTGLPVRATLRATSPDLPETIIAETQPASGVYTLSALSGSALSIQVEALGYAVTRTTVLVPDEDSAAGAIQQDFDLASYDCLAHPALCSRLALRPLGPMGWPPAEGIDWLAINGDIAYVARENELLAIDIGQPDALRLLSVTPIAWQPAHKWSQSRAAVTNNRLIVLRAAPYDAGYALHLLTLEDPLAPRLASVITQSNTPNGAPFAYRGYIYAPEEDAGWRIYTTTGDVLTPVALARDLRFTQPVIKVSMANEGAFIQTLDDNYDMMLMSVSLATPTAPVARDTYSSQAWITDLWAQDGYVYTIENTGPDMSTLKPIRVSAGLTFTVRPPTNWLTRESMLTLSGWPGHLVTAGWRNISLISLANPDKPVLLSQATPSDVDAWWATGMVATPLRVLWHDDQTVYALDTSNRAQPRPLPGLQVPLVRINERRDIARQGQQAYALSNHRLLMFQLADGVIPRPLAIVPERVTARQFVLRPDDRQSRLFHLSSLQPGRITGLALNGNRIVARGWIDIDPTGEITPLQSLHEHNGVVFAVSEWPNPTLYAVSFADLQSPVLLGQTALPAGAAVIAWAGPRLFITNPPQEDSPCSDFRLTTVLLDNPALPTLGGSTSTHACLSNGLGIAHNSWLFTQDSSDLGTLRVFSVDNPLAPQLMLTTTLAAHPQAALGERLFALGGRRDVALAAFALLDPATLIRIPISPTLPDAFSRVAWIEGDFIWHDLAQAETGAGARLYGISVATEARPGQAWRLESVGERAGQPHTRVDIPAGAWSALTAITYTPGLPFGAGEPDQPGLAHIGRVFTLSADAPPQLPLTLTLTYAEDDLGVVPEGTLGLYRWDADIEQWMPEAGAQLDSESNQLTAQINRPGMFALMGAPYRAHVPIVIGERGPAERAIACHNLAANGSFESGPPGVPWQISAAPNDPLIYQSARRSGGWGLWLGARVNYTDTASQRIEAPTQVTTATLRLWWRMSTNETTTRHVYDIARFGLRDAAGAWLSPPITVTNLSARNTWTEASAVIDVSAQAGNQINLTLTSSNDSSRTTSWFVDDVALEVCAPQDAWARPAALINQAQDE